MRAPKKQSRNAMPATTIATKIPVAHIAQTSFGPLASSIDWSIRVVKIG
jgi:hypothetical protein